MSVDLHITLTPWVTVMTGLTASLTEGVKNSQGQQEQKEKVLLQLSGT